MDTWKAIFTTLPRKSWPSARKLFAHYATKVKKFKSYQKTFFDQKVLMGTQNAVSRARPKVFEKKPKTLQSMSGIGKIWWVLPKKVFFLKILLWTRMMKFWQPRHKFHDEKWEFDHSKTVKVVRKLIYMRKLLVIKMFLRTHRLQFWQLS